MGQEILINHLKNAKEINPDLYDGSYQLVNEIIHSYSKLHDYSQVTSLDLDAIYSMVLGTWRCNVEKKKEYIEESSLSKEEKMRLFDVIDEVWNKACTKYYEHREVKGKPSIGMFGSGFYRFKTSDEDAQKFIKLLVDIETDNEEQMLNKCEKVFKEGVQGMGASSASVILHCYKPNVFPILNGNMGMDNAYVSLGLTLNKTKNLDTYIENCRMIKTYRDKHFTFKNYRVFDNASHLIEEKDDFWPSLEEYDPKLSKEDWIKFLKEIEMPDHPLPMKMLVAMLELGGQASCKQLASIYGNVASGYVGCAINLGKRAMKYFNLAGCMDKDKERVFVLPFQGKSIDSEYVYRIRPELKQALESLDLSSINPFYDEEEKPNMNYAKNMILYGPPGTGKTYTTIIYAVAIIENKKIEEVIKEDYDEVLKRYNEYKQKGLIAFTTFHQSYGYEEFIEGIKPVVEDDNDTIKYQIIPGIFKKFCEDSKIVSNETNDYGFNNSPNVWKVSLHKTGDNPIREECMQNNHIRIGWDGYGENLSDITDYYDGGKAILDTFVSKMKIGDIVLSCYSASTIDAIGVVSSEAQWHPEYDQYKRLRKVNWIVKDIKQSILDINNGIQMTLASIYRLNIKVSDIIDLIKQYLPSKNTTNKQNLVFIIDEINRGNISKIFGELITLIEDSKREGMKEAASAILPYSKQQFSVPSNIYILGTMNTADRSIALMDSALRRRFDFIEMMPDVEVLRTIKADKVQDLDVAKMLEVINERISYLYDREHTIGHAFFTKLKNDPSIETLKEIFEKKVIPLLQEYFYEDYYKIQLILGDNSKEDKYKFIIDKEIKTHEVFKGNVDDIVDLDEKQYEINHKALLEIESYKQIM